ncbi:hypothetical protein [Streptomyces albofaciens]|uniref:hypothetical protein n=1 Tax=Streptomyces albofaciens TaxID=66866 RepID=UPI000A9E1474|nr:hypothetical protein [Streptomyces albofaciens]
MRLGKALAVGVAEDVEDVAHAEEKAAGPEVVAERVAAEPVPVDVPEQHPAPAGR